jgi:murein peptide amidase A
MQARALAIAAAAVLTLTPGLQARSGSAVKRVLLGRSVDGRAITAVELGNPKSTRTILVVGCIHGDEPAGVAITDALIRLRPPPNVALWVLPDLNPDGVAAQTRGNADGVDLNRNFPTQWQPLEGTFDSGARPLSEPETRVAYRLIERIRPAVTIWFHQHLDLVDTSTGSQRLERRFARLIGLRTARLPREPGSAVTWQSHRFPTTTAFVVELPAGSPAPAVVTRFTSAIDAIAAAP